MLQDPSRHTDTFLQPSNTVSSIMAGATQTGTRSCVYHSESHTEHQFAEFHADRHQPCVWSHWHIKLRSIQIQRGNMDTNCRRETGNTQHDFRGTDVPKYGIQEDVRTRQRRQVRHLSNGIPLRARRRRYCTSVQRSPNRYFFKTYWWPFEVVVQFVQWRTTFYKKKKSRHSKVVGTTS